MIADEAGGGEIRSRTRVYEGRLFHFDDADVEFEGEVLNRQWIVHPGSVSILALDEEDRVVVLRQYRAPVNAHCWELPAGCLDVPGEGGLETAQRELAEEADLVAGQWATLIDATASSGSTDEIFRVYLATDLAPANSDYERAGEEAHMTVARVPFGEMLDAALNLKILDSATQLGILALDAHRRRGTPLPSAEAPRVL